MASAELKALREELALLPESESIEAERRAWDALCAPLDPVPEVEATRVDAGGVPALSLTPIDGWSREILYCHGGAFALGSGWHNRGMLSRLATAAEARVLAIDYRLAPEHRFPAALEDTLAAWSWRIEGGADPAASVFAGDSCGAALILSAAVAARDRGDLTPAAMVCASPWVDLTLSGSSLVENAERDDFIAAESLAFLAAEYLGGVEPSDPMASPLFADLGLLPPLLIQVGAEEALLSDSLSLARAAAAAGIAVHLEISPEVPHVWQLWAGRVPEAEAAVQRIADFVVATVASRDRPA